MLQVVDIAKDLEEKGQNCVCMGKAVLNAVLKGLKQTCMSEDQGAHQAQRLPAKHALLGNHLVGVRCAKSLHLLQLQDTGFVDDYLP